MRKSLAIVAACGAALVSAQTGIVTPQRPVTDEYFGVKVVDPYRWLDNWDDPEVRAWADAQNQETRKQLDGQPFAEPVRRRVKAVGDTSNAEWYALTSRPRALFALKFQPPLDQPVVVVMPPATAPSGERIVVDPNTLDPSGRTTIDFYVPSHDGTRVAVSLSEGGTENGTVSIFDVADGHRLPDTIPGVNGGTAGGSVAWNADDTGLFYTRYPRGNERPPEDRDFYQQVYFHKLGTAAGADTYELGRDFPRIAETSFKSSDDGKYLLAAVRNGDGGEVAHYMREADGRWRQLAGFKDAVPFIVFGGDDSLYALSHKTAPHGAIVKAAPDAASLDAGKVIYRAADGDITGMVATSNRLVVNQILGGPFEIHVMDLNGGGDRKAPVAPNTTVSGLVAVQDDVLFQSETFTEPAGWRRLNRDGTVTGTPMAVPATVDFTNIVVDRITATSKDGTKVPVSVVHRRDITLDGSHPAILYGYGGYGINTSPSYSATRIVWLEQGGVFAVANLRGGGEFGEGWHEAGKLTNKQHVFDDFIACEKLLVTRRYTSPAKLAILGGSNGGLLMGAVMTQQPSLARAVVSLVGIYDMMRFELWPNGQFNVTEFGSVKDPVQFEALYGYSPYQNVKPNTAYPAVLLLTGVNDPRVNPGDSRRLAARLQAATTSGRPILLRVSGFGHIGASLSEGLAQTADMYTFLFWQLGVKYREIR